MAGFVADNMLSGKVKMIGWRELQAVDRGKVMLVDVRMPAEFAEGTIPGAVNIPLDGSRDEYKNLPKDKTIVIFCAIGLRGYIAARVLMQLGYEVVNLNGGYRTYATVTAGQSNPLLNGNDGNAPVNPSRCTVLGYGGQKVKQIVKQLYAFIRYKRKLN